MATNIQLEQRITELEAWKAEKESQQITFPLDNKSIDALNKYFVRIVDEYIYYGGVNSNMFRNLVGSQDGKQFEVYQSMLRFTADPSSDYVTIADQNPYNKFADDETLSIFTTDTVPSGLSGDGLTTYYVVSTDSTGYKFKLSATSGGSAIDITDAGAGKQFLVRL